MKTRTFKDGDGDLGIDEGNPTFSSYPFHPINYFLELDGDTTKISTEKVYKNVPPLIKINKGQSGKLISVRTRNKPGYENLPAYNCYNYNFDSVYVSKENKSIFDESYYLKDSLVSSTDPTIYILLDTFYIENNPNHYNITVQFETKNSPGTDPQYSPFDWRKEYCTTFDGRFPVLTETKVPLEGSLKYAMPSSGFVDLFSGETLHLIIQIKDRALNLSQ